MPPRHPCHGVVEHRLDPNARRPAGVIGGGSEKIALDESRDKLATRKILLLTGRDPFCMLTDETSSAEIVSTLMSHGKVDVPASPGVQLLAERPIPYGSANGRREAVDRCHGPPRRATRVLLLRTSDGLAS